MKMQLLAWAYLKMAAQSCKYFRRLVAAVAVAALPFLTPGPAAARDVVYIMADDISSSPPVNGYPMPGLASIAEQGVRYTFGHAAPLCTPARVEALTGRLGARFGISANWPKLATTVPTVQSILRSHGWATHFVGKWHVSPKNPLDHGFDTFYGSLKGSGEVFREHARHPHPQPAQALVQPGLHHHYLHRPRGADFQGTRAAAATACCWSGSTMPTTRWRRRPSSWPWSRRA